MVFSVSCIILCTDERQPLSEQCGRIKQEKFDESKSKKICKPEGTWLSTVHS